MDLARLNEAATVCAAAMPFLKGRLWSSQLSIELHWLAVRRKRTNIGLACACLVTLRAHFASVWGLCFSDLVASASVCLRLLRGSNLLRAAPSSDTRHFPIPTSAPPACPPPRQACIADKRGDSMGAAKAARVVINQHPEDLAAWNLFAKTTAQAR